MAAEATQASVTKLYRDCLRLSRHLAGDSAKGEKMREMIRSQFRAGATETDEGKIEMLKFAAVRGLSNYMVRSQSRFQHRVFNIGGLFLYAPVFMLNCDTFVPPLW